jgi:hypothetical protein
MKGGVMRGRYARPAAAECYVFGELAALAGAIAASLTAAAQPVRPAERD